MSRSASAYNPDPMTVRLRAVLRADERADDGSCRHVALLDGPLRIRPKSRLRLPRRLRSSLVLARRARAEPVRALAVHAAAGAQRRRARSAAPLPPARVGRFRSFVGSLVPTRLSVADFDVCCVGAFCPVLPNSVRPPSLKAYGRTFIALVLTSYQQVCVELCWFVCLGVASRLHLLLVVS